MSDTTVKKEMLTEGFKNLHESCGDACLVTPSCHGVLSHVRLIGELLSASMRYSGNRAVLRPADRVNHAYLGDPQQRWRHPEN